MGGHELRQVLGVFANLHEFHVHTLAALGYLGFHGRGHLLGQHAGGRRTGEARGENH